MRCTFVISLLICLSAQLTHLCAQFDISGQVLFSPTQTPIADAEIYHHQSQSIQQTDETGEYTFTNLPKGQHYFTVFAQNCTTITDSLNITESRAYNFNLDDLSLDLSAIDIVAKKQELFAIKQLKDVEGTSIYAGKKTEVVILDLVRGNVALNNARQVYAQVAGLNIYEGNDGGLQLNLGGRGLDPNRTSNFNTRQNGYDISADVLGYPENYYTPPSEAISQVNIIRGASSLQYGTQFGGLIDFKLHKAPSFKSFELISNQTVGSFNSFNSFNAIGINKGKLAINTFYNYKRGDGYRPDAAYDSHNYHLSLDYKFSKKSKIGFEYTYFNYLAKQAGGLTDEQFQETPRLSTRDRNWLGVDWNLFNLKYEHQFNSNNFLTVSLFGLDATRETVGYRGNPINLNENPITSIDERDSNGNYISPRDVITGDFNNYGIETKYLTHYKLGQKKSVLLVGAKFYKSDNSSEQGPGSTGVNADFEIKASSFPDYPNQSNFSFPNLNTSLFAENIFYLSDRLSITPGVRLEYINTKAEGTYNQVIFDIAENPIANILLDESQNLSREFALFGIGVKYEKSKSLKLIANISQNYRSVTFSDIRVVSPTFIVDPNIRDEKGFTADIGLNGKVSKYLSYDLTLYSILYDDRIGIILDDRANRVRKNIGQAVIAGTESLVNFNFGRWLTPVERNYKLNIFLNTAFTYSEYLKSEESNVVGNRVEFIPKVNFKGGVNAGYENFDLSFQLSYLSEQFTDVQNSRRAAAGDIRSGIIGEIPAYLVADLTASYQLDKLKFTAGINNIMNENFFTRRATGYPGPGIIPSDGRSFFLTAGIRL